jgi:hypothetical protein
MFEKEIILKEQPAARCLLQCSLARKLPGPNARIGGMVQTHAERELAVIEDLERSFPDFTRRALSWVHNPDDPPDFIATVPNGAVGLELREWLDGEQMNTAQAHDRQREHLADIFGAGWEQEYQPTNFALASVEPLWGLRVVKKDEPALRREFYECATAVDQTWLMNPERIARCLYQMEFSGYPTMQKYLWAIRYTGGPPHGLIWVQIEEDGGAYSPTASLQSLEEALDDKLLKFDRPEWLRSTCETQSDRAPLADSRWMERL